MNELPPYLLSTLDKLLARIDREMAGLERMSENQHISEVMRQKIKDQIFGLRKTKLEITQLMSRLERL